MALCDDCRCWFAETIEKGRFQDVQGKSIAEISVRDLVAAAGQSREVKSARLVQDGQQTSEAPAQDDPLPDAGTTPGQSQAGEATDESSASAGNLLDPSGYLEEKKFTRILQDSSRSWSGILNRKDSCWLCALFYIQLQRAVESNRSSTLTTRPDNHSEPLSRLRDVSDQDIDDLDYVLLGVTFTAYLSFGLPDDDSRKATFTLEIESMDLSESMKMILVDRLPRESHPDHYWNLDSLKCQNVFKYSLGAGISSSPMLKLDGCMPIRPDTARNYREVEHLYCEPDRLLCDCRLKEIQAWIRTCRTSHSLCNAGFTASEGTRVLPARLVWVGSNAEDVKLYETKAMAGAQYATLSHCWGTKPFLKLTKHNHDQFRDAIPFARLSRTFREAIEVCRQLNIDWLWIDCLCIVQDSEGASDWLSEASKMHHVYANSVLNLCATDSVDADMGLVRPKNSVLHESPRFSFPNGLDFRFVTASRSLMRAYDKSPLPQRGWILQECFLAPRVLHFTISQVLWQCKEMADSEFVQVAGGRENGHSNNPWEWYSVIHKKLFYFDTLASVSTIEELEKVWAKIARDFSPTAVTRPEDRYFALAGLAASVHGRFRQLGLTTEYIAGVWQHDILRSIGWRVHGSRPKPKPSVFIPSWSWMNSWPCMDISFDGRDHNPLSGYSFSVAQIDVEYADPKFRYGPVKKAHLLVDSLFFECDLSDCVPGYSTPDTFSFSGGKSSTAGVSFPDKDSEGSWLVSHTKSLDLDHRFPPAKSQCMVLFIERRATLFTMDAMVLQPVASQLGGVECFERAGLLKIESNMMYEDHIPQMPDEYWRVLDFFRESELLSKRICLV